jgi:ribose 5-phosphate isomerase B
MKIAIAADHGGFPLKQDLVERLKTEYDIVDLGAHQLGLSDDYPTFAQLVARAVIAGQVEKGIVLCGSGVGACIAANSLGARVIGIELAAEVVNAFLRARFLTDARFRRRYNMVLDIERSQLEAHRNA